MTDGWGTHGSGVGDALRAQHSGLGEYYERRHFYLEVFRDGSSTLENSLPLAEASAFAEALKQTSLHDDAKESINSHSFSMSNVIRTGDFTECQIPTCLISIGQYHLKEDRCFYPRRDTCGCSFHHNLDMAVKVAVKESVERQLLIKFWLTGECSGHISLAQAMTLLDHCNTQLLSLLSESGELNFFDLSDMRFPGACVLATYGNASPKRDVRYCAGMSYSSNLVEAIEKSIFELWQTFRFMAGYKYTTPQDSPALDPYLEHFLNCNNYATFLDIKDNTVATISKHIPNPEPLNTESLLTSLKRHGFGGYLYIRPETIGTHTFYYCKFVSPDFFLHMNNSANINTSNKFSSAFQDRIIPSRRSVMVPFP